MFNIYLGYESAKSVDFITNGILNRIDGTKTTIQIFMDSLDFISVKYKGQPPQSAETKQEAQIILCPTKEPRPDGIYNA